MSLYCGADGKWVDEGPCRAVPNILAKQQTHIKAADMLPAGESIPARKDARVVRCEVCDERTSGARLCHTCRRAVKGGVAI